MLKIVYNHADWIIVNKPTGISMQQEQDNPSADSLLQNALSEVQKIDSQTTRLWPVHRLDKATSGLVIFAKNASAAAEFGRLFEQHKIEKHYLAIACGKPRKKQGWVKGDMEKGRNGSWLLKRSLNKPAITHFISCAIESNTPPAKRLYLVSPKSGKTHQIRVALKSLGCAILGDARYKGEPANRCYLHAFSLKFEWQGEQQAHICLPTADMPTSETQQDHWPILDDVELLAPFFTN